MGEETEMDWLQLLLDPVLYCTFHAVSLPPACHVSVAEFEETKEAIRLCGVGHETGVRSISNLMLFFFVSHAVQVILGFDGLMSSELAAQLLW